MHPPVHDEPLAGIPLAGHGETGEAEACVGAHSPRPERLRCGDCE
jgi:hypothetical protein